MPAPFQRAAKQRFTVPGSVYLGSVDEVDAHLRQAIDNLRGGLCITVPGGAAANLPCAECDTGDGDAALSQLLCLHESKRSFLRVEIWKRKTCAFV